jgi:two-component system chemotaxis response regulator CheB
MMNNSNKIIVIGGSAGSFPIIMNLLPALPAHFDVPIIIVLHRLRNVFSEMANLFSKVTNEHIIHEPEDKEPIQPGNIYLAPQNYHLLIEPDKVFSLDYSEQINFSRPSIDMSFISTANVYKENCMGVLLSGSNRDGANGLHHILKNGGTAVIQDPIDASYDTMPKEAIKLNPAALVADSQTILQLIVKSIISSNGNN